MTPTFPGILGREFARVDKTARALRPGSVPGMLVSRTTNGLRLKPIPPRPARSDFQLREVDVFAVFDDLIYTSWYGADMWIAKPHALCTSLWRGNPVLNGTPPFASVSYPDSWMPGDPFRWKFGIFHPRFQQSEMGYDFMYYGAQARTLVWERTANVPHLGTLDYVYDQQIIWPPYVWETHTLPMPGPMGGGISSFDHRPIRALYVKEGATHPVTRQPLILDKDYIAANNLPAQEGTLVQWIDLNVDARQWQSCGVLTQEQASLGSQGSTYQVDPVINNVQDWH